MLPPVPRQKKRSEYGLHAKLSGLILSSPWVFYQIWMFVGAGLYEHERRYVRHAVPFSTLLFVVGASATGLQLAAEIHGVSKGVLPVEIGVRVVF